MGISFPPQLTAEKEKPVQLNKYLEREQKIYVEKPYEKKKKKQL